MADTNEDSVSGEERQVAAKDAKYPLSHTYCPSCTLPPDYCKYSANFSKCKPWLLKNYPQLYPELAEDPELQGLIKQVDGVTLIDDNAVAASIAEPSSSTGGKKGKAKQPEGPMEITISCVARTKKKFHTHVTGLGRFGIKLQDAARVFAKRFAAASSVTPNADEIIIQGEVTDTLADFIVQHWTGKITKGHVFIMEDGKKRNMDD